MYVCMSVYVCMGACMRVCKYCCVCMYVYGHMQYVSLLWFRKLVTREQARGLCDATNTLHAHTYIHINTFDIHMSMPLPSPQLDAPKQQSLHTYIRAYIQACKLLGLFLPMIHSC
jgi:hypothetical protein